MKEYSPHFNKKSRLIKAPEITPQDATSLPEFEPHTLTQRLSDILQVQNDFYPCFDWTFPPPILSPGAKPCPPEELFAEPSIIPGKYSLYLHSPFCETLCNFCYYTVFPGKGINEADRYIDYLLREMEMYAESLQGMQCESVYFGGGTPTHLPSHLLIKVFDGLRQYFDIASEAEITIEAAPGTLPDDKIVLLHTLGVNRISYGIQTLDEELLAGMNRNYSVDQAKHELQQALRVFHNINVDTMYGFDNEGDDALINTLQQFNALGIPSLSIYSLDKQRCGTNLNPEGPNKDVLYKKKIEIFAQAKAYLLSEGFQPVLQNIFAKPEKSSYQHQVRRWENLPLVALGIAAQGYAPQKPYQNAVTIKSYYQCIDEGRLPLTSVDRLTPEMELAREVASRLRFTEVPVEDIFDKYGVNLHVVFGDLISSLSKLGLASCDEGVLKLTPKAAYYNNIIPMLFAPDAFKEELLGLPEEFLENYPIPHVMTRLGKTQSTPITVRSSVTRLQSSLDNQLDEADWTYSQATADPHQTAATET